MKTLKKRVNLFILFLVTMSLLTGALPASAATTWAFSTGNGKTKASVNGTVSLKKGDYLDMNLYRNGKQIKEKDATYQVLWYSSDKNVVYVDKPTGKMKVDKYGKIKTDAAEAKITAVIKNKKTGSTTKKSFLVKVSADPTEEISKNLKKTTQNIGVRVPVNSISLSYCSNVSAISQFAAPSDRYGVAYNVEYGESSDLIILLYNKDLSLHKTIVIKKELSMVGGVIADTAGNYYVVYGSDNDTDDLTKEVLRIVKYSAKGTRLASISYTGEDTISLDGTKYPFNAGNCSMALNGSILICTYAREMYNGHQSNHVIYVHTEPLLKLDFVPCYTSHSFDQRVLVTSNGEYLFVDHGDAYPRAFSVNLIQEDIFTSNLASFHFREGSNRSHGYNETYAQLGGIAETASSFILVGASERTLSLSTAPTPYYCGHNEARDLFIQYIKKDFYDFDVSDSYTVTGETRAATGSSPFSAATELFLSSDTVDYGVNWLTEYSDEYLAYNPKVLATDDSVIVLWQKNKYSSGELVDTYYMVLGSDGSVKKSATSIGKVWLSRDEDPIYLNGKIYWTIPDGNSSLITYCFTP